MVAVRLVVSRVSHLGDTEVTDGEADRGVVGVESPTTRGEGECSGSGHAVMVDAPVDIGKAGSILVPVGPR
jgi:hypothetical protein